jgi:toxin ParE1/3/4
MRVAWTRRSTLRLRQILEHIARDQPENATRFVNQLIKRGDSVGELPLRGRIVPEYEDESIREIFEAAYRIIYKVRFDRVDILTVRHGSQVLPDAVQNL